MRMKMPIGIGRHLKLTGIHIFLLKSTSDIKMKKFDDFDTRGSRSLREIYQRCKVVSLNSLTMKMQVKWRNETKL